MLLSFQSHIEVLLRNDSAGQQQELARALPPWAGGPGSAFGWAMTILLEKKSENGYIFLRPIQNQDNSILSKGERLAADAAAASCPRNPSARWGEPRVAGSRAGARGLPRHLSLFPPQITKWDEPADLLRERQRQRQGQRC